MKINAFGEINLIYYRTCAIKKEIYIISICRIHICIYTIILLWESSLSAWLSLSIRFVVGVVIGFWTTIWTVLWYRAIVFIDVFRIYKNIRGGNIPINYNNKIPFPLGLNVFIIELPLIIQ
jgi:hypothetical protein